ncbi:MAG: SufD family Fe-S cluster assembly protein, partial [Acidimicrobiales bacterium]|nr:SufD family Fe-S cluster assembly protein [Acidimicrobiales bacterium]
MIERRVAAAERAEAVGLPSIAEEVWRYSRIDELDLDRFAPPGSVVPAATSVAAARDAGVGVRAALGSIGAVAVVANGYLAEVELSEAARASGVRLGRLCDLDPEGVVFEALSAEPVDVFGHLNQAFCDPLLLEIPSGVTIEEPILVVDWVDASGGALFPRLLVRLGEDAVATLVEWHCSSEVEALVVPLIDVLVGRGARLRHLLIQDRAESVWQLARHVSTVEQDASLTSTQAVLGGWYARSRTDCQLVGRGASGYLNAAYFAHHDQVLDFRTFQLHAAPDTSSNCLLYTS